MEKLVGPTDLRAQARRFQDAATKLLEAADVLEGIPAHAATATTTTSNGHHPRARGGRINEMIALLKQQPMTARAIVDKMGVSRGAVYAWLTDRNQFVNTDGIWHVKAH